MTLSPDLAERVYHWLRDLPNAGHMPSCRLLDKMALQQGACNCGLSGLMVGLAKAADAPDVMPNGLHE